MAQPTASPAPKTAPAPADGKITIDDFLKVEMRVGEVKHAEKVKGADKLLRLEVDIGTEVRQVVAGIAVSYDPEKLIGRKVVIVANLAPRKLRGLGIQWHDRCRVFRRRGQAGAGKLPGRCAGGIEIKVSKRLDCFCLLGVISLTNHGDCRSAGD